MYCVPVGASRRLRWGCLSLAAIVAMLAVTSDPADARRRHKRSHGKLTSISSKYNPPYAAIVVDANNGAVLHAAAPDAPRHPASLTKIMTLYLLFERLESGKIALDTPMEVSEDASIQAPTKLGLRPGDTIKVEDAIKGLVTKSANDASVVIAEAIGGTEEEFARAMTRKARALGMRNTTYRNANGLPNDEQITTARDQALLGIAIQERFPKYYRYFSLASFVYRGNAMRNHNHLLGKVEGVDGIKTGFTRDSGFNLVTSVRRGASPYRRGGAGRPLRRQPRRPDARTDRSQHRRCIDQAGASRWSPRQNPKPRAAPAAKPQLASAEPAQVSLGAAFAREVSAAISPGSTAPLTPVKVKTVVVKLVPPKNARREPAKPQPVRTAELSPAGQDEALAETLAAPPDRLHALAAVAPADRAPATNPGVLGKLPAMMAAAKEAAIPSARAEPAAAKPSRQALQDRRTLPIRASPPRHPQRLGHPGRRL